MAEQTTIPNQKVSSELVKSGVITEQQKAEIEKLPDSAAELKEGWGFPLLSKKAHYFFEGRSLCRRWAYLGVLEQGNDTSPDNCKICIKERMKRKEWE